MRPELAARIAAREQVLETLGRVLIARLKLRCGTDELDPDVPLFGSGLGLDSLDAVEVVVALESELDVRLTDGPADRSWLRTMNTLADLVLMRRETR